MSSQPTQYKCRFCSQTFLYVNSRTAHEKYCIRTRRQHNSKLSRNHQHPDGTERLSHLWNRQGSIEELIEIAFMQPGVPLSDLVRGIFGIMPPELLHTTCEGITMYIIEIIGTILGNNKVGEEAKNVLDSLHQTVEERLKRNSERDILRGSARSSFLKNSRVNADQRRGNLWRFLLITYTTTFTNKVSHLLESYGIDVLKMQQSLKMYLAMEEWFHSNNSIIEVRSARPLIVDVINLIQEVFPRTTGDGWNIQKMHGWAKMQVYICRYGNGINFFLDPANVITKR